MEELNKKKSASVQLLKSEEIYKVLFESALDEIIYFDKNGNCLGVNDRIEDIFGVKPEEVVGKKVTYLKKYLKVSLPELVKLFQDFMKEGKTNTITMEGHHKDGHKVWVEVNSNAIRDNGKIVGVLAHVRDTTERKESEEELEKAYNELKDQAEELQRVNDHLLSREARVVELKEKIQELEAKLKSK